MKWSYGMTIKTQQAREVITDATHAVVLYHADCLDGFGAAYAAWLALGDNGVAYVPMQYGQDVPEGLGGRTVYILDFCYNNPLQLGRIEGRSRKLIVIDHHKTSKAIIRNFRSSNPDFVGIWDVAKSGAVLAWEYFHNGAQIPFELMLIQDRDLWQFKYANTKDFCAGLYSLVDRSFEAWQETFDDCTLWDTNIERGKAINKVFNKDCQELVDKYSYPCRIHFWNDHAVEFTEEGLAINAPAKYASELGNILELKSQTYGAVWQYEGAGKYKVSLRSVGDYDVEVIAKYYGGGGHKNAAGFIIQDCVKLNEFIEDISNEQ